MFGVLLHKSNIKIKWMNSRKITFQHSNAQLINLSLQTVKVVRFVLPASFIMLLKKRAQLAKNYKNIFQILMNASKPIRNQTTMQVKIGSLKMVIASQ